jgi:anti-sigma regulatory factor (Ser/Thr protein kinase)
MGESEIIIEKGNLQDVPRIIEFVVNWLRMEGLEKLTFYMETAVDEAVTNIFKHGYSGNAGYIRVRCYRRDDSVYITIYDRAPSFDPSAVPPPDLDTDLEERRVGGLGVYMMRKMMDEVKYNFHTTGGNELILRKKIG